MLRPEIKMGKRRSDGTFSNGKTRKEADDGRFQTKTFRPAHIPAGLVELGFADVGCDGQHRIHPAMELGGSWGSPYRLEAKAQQSVERPTSERSQLKQNRADARRRSVMGRLCVVWSIDICLLVVFTGWSVNDRPRCTYTQATR